MIAGLNKFVDKLITPVLGKPEEKQFRWTYKNNRVSYLAKSKVTFSSTQKIERVLQRLNASFKRYDNVRIDKEAYDKMGVLMQSVEQHVQKYKSKHCKIYLLLSRLFGNIDKISKEFIDHLQDLRGHYNPNDIGEAKKLDPFVDLPNDNDDFHFPINIPKKEPSKKTPRPPHQVASNESWDFAKPPVYAPYIAPAIDETAKLENQIKNSRLKFFELFGNQLQISENEHVLPILEITDKTVTVNIPKTLSDRGFDAEVEQVLKGLQVQFEVKQLGRKQVVGKKEIVIPHPIEGVGCVKEIKFSLLEAEKIVKTLPEKGISSLSKLMKNREIKIYHAQTSQIWGNEPNLEDTIGLTLAHLNPELHNQLGDVKANPMLHKDYPVPIIEFDDQGMIIKIPEKDNENFDFKNVLSQLFGLKKVVENHVEMEEVQFDRTYKIYRLHRDGIENFLVQLGLDKIPSEGLHEHYANGQVTYLQHLIETHRYHPYRAQRSNDVLESISKSLSVLVPNELQVTPYVSYHPRGWLSIKMSDLNPDYNKMLSDFLKIESFEILQEFNGDRYIHEIVIHEEQLPTFLNTLKLKNNPRGVSYADLLNECKQPSLDVFYAETEDNQIDIPRTIARILSVLEPDTKGIFHAGEYTPQALPELDLPLVQVNYVRDGLEIKVPKALNERTIAMGQGKNLNFGPYLSHVFALEGKKRREKNEKEEFYCMKVPMHRIKSFLEKDLSLRYLSPEYRKSNIVTFLNQYNHDVHKLFGFGQKIPAHGSLADLSLHNPPIPVPEDIPGMSDKDVLDAINKILDKHPKKETTLHVFIDTFKRITPDKDNPDIDDYRKFQRTAEAIRPYLKQITHKLLNDPVLQEDDKREFIIELARGCKGICLPGRLTNIQLDYQNLIHPELADKVRFFLLDKIQKIKEEELKSIFGKEAHNVHIINLIKVEWGAELGLNEEEGRLDEELFASKWAPHEVRAAKRQQREDFKLLYLKNENKEKFLSACRKKLLDVVFDSVRADKEELMENLSYYQERLRKILKEEGLKPGSKPNLKVGEPNQIEDEIARLVPKQEDLRKILNEKGKMALLVHMYGDTNEMSKENIDKIKKQFTNDKEIDAEIKQIFSSDDDENYTIRKEAIKILLIDIGILNP